jgi:hypothetical protein
LAGRRCRWVSKTRIFTSCPTNGSNTETASIRQNNRVEVIDIDDVSFKQGIIETMFNVGNIHIRSSDTSHPNLVLRGISDVKRVSDLIDNARRNERTKRGLYVESI